MLFRLSAETLLEVAHNPKRLGADIGFFSVLHTWSQKLELHPHVHCVVPAGGLSLNHTSWVRPRHCFFLPAKALGLVFRAKIRKALEDAFTQSKLGFHGELQNLSDPKAFHAFVRQLFRHEWVVHCKAPFGGPEHVLRYLGRYTHRVAISNHRLVSFEDGKVTFLWRDRAHGNRQLPMTLTADEFLRRFLLHLLPKRFVRIRNFGFLANRKRSTLLPVCLRLLGSVREASNHQEQAASDSVESLAMCPRCGGPMIMIMLMTAADVLLRSPPLLTSVDCYPGAQV